MPRRHTLSAKPIARRLGLAGMVAGLIVTACTTGSGTGSAPSETAMQHSASPSALASSSQAVGSSPSAPAPVAQGAFHAVDGSASGTVALFHLPDGSFKVTFEDFSIGSATGVDVVLVTARDVSASSDVDRSTWVDLGALTGTGGMQDFSVPATADAMTYHAVVLWDSQMGHAIAAAPLG